MLPHPRTPHPPPDATFGTFPPIPHDQPATGRVLSATLTTDDDVTATLSAGTPFFAVAGITVSNWIWQDISDELPYGYKGLATHQWIPQQVALSNGQTPLHVLRAQSISVLVRARVALNAIPPGLFKGTLLVQGQHFSRTVDLVGTYLAVDENTPIGHKWKQMGGEAFFGQVLTNEAPTSDGRAITQEFTNGVLCEPAPALVFPIRVCYMTTAIFSTWEYLDPSVLGQPREDSFPTSDGGQAMRFDSGAVVARADGGVYVVQGAIYTKYAQLGNLLDASAQPVVGLPSSDEGPADPLFASDPFRMQRFDNGAICWSAATGAHETHGAIWQHWNDIGESIGNPVTDETGTPDGIGRFNRFEQGMIYWTRNTGAHDLHGDILDRWSSLGYEKSYLGYPISDVKPWTNITDKASPWVIATFQKGQIAANLVTHGVTEQPQRSWPGNVITPAGTALGGWVNMTLRSDGSYTVQFHLHDSSLFETFDFTVRTVLVAKSGVAVALQQSGHVGPGEGGNDYFQNGTHQFIRDNWIDLLNSTLWVTKDYSTGGIGGFLEDVGKAVLDLTAGAVGTVIGVVIALGSEVGQLLGVSGLGTAFGVIAGFVVFAAATIAGAGVGGALVYAVVAGVAVGAVTEALIKQRPISPQEYQFANAVFNGTLPAPDQIILTNCSSVTGQAFTMPGADGKIYVNLGNAFSDPAHAVYPNSYAQPGQVLIHELTHVWQIAHSAFVPGTVCSGIVNQANYLAGESVYQYGTPDIPWSEINLEAQGAIVDQWFGGTQTAVVPNRTAMDANDPYFHYIRDNIRAGNAG